MWEALTAISTLFTGIVIAVTAIAAVIQLQHLRAQRRDSATLELIRSLQDPEVMRAFTRIMRLPIDASPETLAQYGPEFEQAAHVLGLRFEMLGMLVFRGTVSFAVAQELAGGGVVGVWRRLKNTVLETRRTQHQPRYLEWFQWLAEQYEKRGTIEQRPSYERFAEWTPREAPE
jgi:hypothetical protein